MKLKGCTIDERRFRRAIGDQYSSSSTAPSTFSSSFRLAKNGGSLRAQSRHVVLRPLVAPTVDVADSQLTASSSSSSSQRPFTPRRNLSVRERDDDSSSSTTIVDSRRAYDAQQLVLRRRDVAVDAVARAATVEHRLHGTPLAPAAVILRALAAHVPRGECTLRDVRFVEKLSAAELDSPLETIYRDGRLQLVRRSVQDVIKDATRRLQNDSLEPDDNEWQTKIVRQLHCGGAAARDGQHARCCGGCRLVARN